MNWANSEVVATLIFLLPGFIAAAVFYSLTSHPKPGAFDRVVVALIFTLIGQTISEFLFQEKFGLQSAYSDVQSWQDVFSIVVAVCLGLLATTITNSDWLHAPLRYLRITRENSYPSEWFSVFGFHQSRRFMLRCIAPQGRAKVIRICRGVAKRPKHWSFSSCWCRMA